MLKFCRLTLPVVWLSVYLWLCMFSNTMLTEARYTDHVFACSGWLLPVDAKDYPLKETSDIPVGFYLTKYVNIYSFTKLAAKGRLFFFFLNDPAPPETSPLPQHDALPI